MPEQTNIDWYRLMDEALTAPGQLGTTYNRFHEYSLTNNFLFLMQGIHEPVASYKRWQSLGRHVLRGAQAKQVIVPLIVRDQRDERDKPAEPVERLIGFKVVRGVFALSDTGGDPLPPIQFPTWDLNTALTRLKITRVPFRLVNGNVQGYSVDREIAVNPVAVNPHKTLMHELGHVVLGHTVADTQSEYANHRGMMEFQAEATAYLSMNELGQLDPETAFHSRGYIRHWLQDERPREREVRLVFAATDQILRAGRLAIGHSLSTEGTA